LGFPSNTFALLLKSSPSQREGGGFGVDVFPFEGANEGVFRCFLSLPYLFPRRSRRKGENFKRKRKREDLRRVPSPSLVLPLPRGGGGFGEEKGEVRGFLSYPPPRRGGSAPYILPLEEGED